MILISRKWKYSIYNKFGGAKMLCSILWAHILLLQIYHRILHRRFAHGRWNVCGNSVVENSGLATDQPQICLLSQENYLFKKRSEVLVGIKPGPAVHSLKPVKTQIKIQFWSSNKPHFINPTLRNPSIYLWIHFRLKFINPTLRHCQIY